MKQKFNIFIYFCHNYWIFKLKKKKLRI